MKRAIFYNRVFLVGGTAIIGVIAIFGFLVWYWTSIVVAQLSDDPWKTFQTGGMFLPGAPSESSDGERIVFASACTGHGDIYVVDRIDEATTRLTYSDSYESSPVYLPKHHRIAFTRQSNGRRHVWLMDDVGGNERQVTTGNVQDDVFSVSADARFAIILRCSLSINSLVGHGRQAALVVCSFENTTQPPVDVGISAVFSPDSKSVIFAPPNGPIKTLSLKSRQSLATNLSCIGLPLGLSQNGKTLLMSREALRRPLEREFWICDLESGREQYIGIGFQAMIGGVGSTKVIYLAGDNPQVYSPSRLCMTDVESGDSQSVPWNLHYCTHFRQTSNTEACLTGGGLQFGRPEYEVIRIEFENLLPVTIAMPCNER